MRIIIIGEVKYDLTVSIESNVIQSASCVGYFDYPIICMGEEHVDLEHTFCATKTKPKDSGMNIFNSSDYGPQYTVKPELYYNDEEGRKYCTCMHDVVQSEDGYSCIKCGEFFPATIKATEVYSYLDSVGFTTDEDKLTDNNFFDWYVAETKNPELLTRNMQHKYSDPEFYDTYGGLLPEVDDKDWKENVKCRYFEDANGEQNTEEEFVEGYGDEDEITDSENTVVAENEYSKDATELPKELLNFWGYPKMKGCAGGHSVIWTAVRFGRDNAIAKVMEVKDQLSEGDLEWLREILGDKFITMSSTIRNLIPLMKYGTKDAYTKSHDAYMQSEGWAKAYARLLNSNKTPEPTPPKGSKTENVINNESVEQKYMIIDFYKSLPNCREGTIIVFEYINGKFGKSKAFPILSDLNCEKANEKALSQINNLKEKHEQMGYTVIVRNMDEICIKEHNRTASRIAMRRLWSDIENYATLVKSTKYACLV